MARRYLSVFFVLTVLFPTGKSWGGSGQDSLRATKEWKAMQSRVQGDVYSDSNIAALETFIRAFPKSEYAADARFAIGEIYFKKSRYEDAWPQYKLILEQKNGVYRDDVLLRLGEIQYNTGNIRIARDYWREIAGKFFGQSVLSAEAQYYLIVCDLREKDYMGASKKLELLVQKYPAYKDLPKVRELAGIVRFQEKNYPKALEVLEDIQTPAGEFYRGLSHFQLKQYLEAAECFKKLASESKGGYAEMGMYLKAESFRLGGNDNLAAQVYGQFANEYRGSRLRPYAFVHLARTLINSKRYDKALEVLQITGGIPDISKNIAAYSLSLRAAIYAKTGNYTAAATYLGSALAVIDKKESPELFGSICVAQGGYLLKQGDFSGAVASMKGLLRETPYHPLGMPASMVMGNAAYMRKDWNLAVNAYESALLRYKYCELSDIAMAMLLRTYYAAGRYSELVTNANRVMKLITSEFGTQNFLWRSYSFFLLAEAYYKLEQYAKASEYYRKAARHPSLEPLSNLYLAWALYHEGKYADSASTARQVSASGQNTYTGKASAGFLAAACLLNQKQYDQAIAAFRDFRRQFPGDAHVPESYFQEGVACKLARYFKDALRVWAELTALFPGDSSSQEAQINIGRLYFQARQYDNAVKAFGDLLKKWPKTDLAPEALWMMAQSYYNAKKYDDAIPVYEAFLRDYPNDSRVENCREQLMLAYYGRAIVTNEPRFLEHFVQTYPKSTLAPEAQYMLGYIAYSRQNWSAAVTQMRQLLLNYPGTPQAPTALLAVGRAQEHLQNTDTAVMEYESVVTMFPGTTYALDAAMRLGAIYFSQEKFTEAANKFTFLAEHSPEGQAKADAVYNTAVSYKRAQDFADALRAYEKFAANYENDPRQIDALLEIAAIHSNSDEHQKTLDTYQRILESANAKATPELRMSIYNRIGEIYQTKAGDPKKAAVAYSQLIPMKPANDQSRLLGLAQLAAIYESGGDWGSALAVYKQIAASGGRADWVQTAVKRSSEIQDYLKALKTSGQAAVGAPGQKAEGSEEAPQSGKKAD